MATTTTTNNNNNNNKIYIYLREYSYKEGHVKLLHNTIFNTELRGEDSKFWKTVVKIRIWN